MNATVSKVHELHLSDGISLAISPGANHGAHYPSGKLQKGLILLHHGQELCEEAVGFGVPVAKRGLQAIFPGSVELTPGVNGASGTIHAVYTLNLVEKIEAPGARTLTNPLLYGGKNILAALIRRVPLLRGWLTRLSSRLRERYAWETVYEAAEFYTTIRMTYAAHPAQSKIRIGLENLGARGDGITEMVVMNEQGAHYFDRYSDSDGVVLQGDAIGCWDGVAAAQASFTSREQQISFTLPQVQGARLYRGRELIAGRLAWAGFGYSFSPELHDFVYEISLKGSA